MSDPMQPEVFLFGGIGTLLEVSEIDRMAFNQAFADAGLDCKWDSETYRQLLQTQDEADRIERFARAHGERADGRQLRARKEAAFKAALQPNALVPRLGVMEMVAACRAHRVTIGLASDDEPDAVAAALHSLGPDFAPDRFAFVGDGGQVAAAKPDPEIYRHALETLGAEASVAMAVEDTPAGARAAISAGIKTYAFPGSANRGRSFEGVMGVLDKLEPERLLALDPSAQARPIMM